MKVKNSISTTMRTLKGKETKDKAAKNIFSYKPIMGNILKYTVAEYSDCSLEEIINCIEGDTIQTGTAFVEEDMAGSRIQQKGKPCHKHNHNQKRHQTRHPLFLHFLYLFLRLPPNAT